MSDEVIAAAAVDVHNHTVLLGKALRTMREARDAHRRVAYDEGGSAAVNDFNNDWGDDRIYAELLGLMVAVGMGPLLVASRGRQDHRPVLNFADRYVHLAGCVSGLATHRGQPSDDPLSGHRAPGVKVTKL